MNAGRSVIVSGTGNIFDISGQQCLKIPWFHDRRRHTGAPLFDIENVKSANSYANDLPIPKSKSISSGQYQDGYVALKQLPEYYSTIGDRNSVTNSRFQIEIDQIRELCQIQHNHLARFFGIYKSIDLPTSLVTEYGTKGSLQDLLEDNGKDTPVI